MDDRVQNSKKVFGHADGSIRGENEDVVVGLLGHDG